MVGFPTFQNNNNNQQSMIFCSDQILLLHTLNLFLKCQLSFKRAIFSTNHKKKLIKIVCKLLFAYIIIKHKQRYYSVTNESQYSFCEFFSSSSKDKVIGNCLKLLIHNRCITYVYAPSTRHVMLSRPGSLNLLITRTTRFPYLRRYE